MYCDCGETRCPGMRVAAQRDSSQALAMSVSEAESVSRAKGRAISAVSRESKASDGNGGGVRMQQQWVVSR